MMAGLALSEFSLADGVEHYFRLAVSYLSYSASMGVYELMSQFVQGGAALDYINPVTLYSNGTWSL